MNRLTTMLVTALLLGSTITAVHASAPDSPAAAAQQPVDGFRFFGRLDNWRAVDRDTLIVWVTPARPYLIELSRPSTDLRFARIVGITSTTGKVRANLDFVTVRGFHYPIEAIYALSRDEARHWRRRAS